MAANAATVNSARADGVSGFNSQNSYSRLGPSCGSGAYAQKQKVGVLEDMQKKQGAVSLAVPRKSVSNTYNLQRKANIKSQGGLSKINANKAGYNQF